ncbi:MAG TPA: XRE family transcriptional regulator [Clostridiales bacterium]|nr:XRE family transcriptional regulator [Clostridiales bacterium]
MITYAPFWKTIKEKGESTYTLIEKHGISSATIDRLRKNKGISTAKINDLCRILDCSVSEILEYVPDKN